MAAVNQCSMLPEIQRRCEHNRVNLDLSRLGLTSLPAQLRASSLAAAAAGAASAGAAGEHALLTSFPSACCSSYLCCCCRRCSGAEGRQERGQGLALRLMFSLLCSVGLPLQSILLTLKTLNLEENPLGALSADIGTIPFPVVQQAPHFDLVRQALSLRSRN